MISYFVLYLFLVNHRKIKIKILIVLDFTSLGLHSEYSIRSEKKLETQGSSSGQLEVARGP